jgi:YfiH family protein
MESKLLSSIPGLLYGCSMRVDGSMRIQTREELARPERVTYFRSLGISVEQTAGCALAHGKRVQEVSVSEKRPLFFDQTDGLYTLDTSRILTITGADCFPVYVVDPVTRVTGLCHAGWQGVIEGVLPELLQQMTKKFHCSMESLSVVIGPGIRVCHFEVKLDVRSRFAATDRVMRAEKTYIDLPKLLMQQAKICGVRAEFLEDTGICTVCDERYFSYRRDAPKEIEAQVAYLGWKL